MNVRAIAWMGVQTERFEEMQAFMSTVLGSPPPVQEPGFALWDLPSGDLVELFAHGRKPTFGTAPVVGLLVDDLEAARRGLAEREAATFPTTVVPGGLLIDPERALGARFVLAAG